MFSKIIWYPVYLVEVAYILTIGRVIHRLTLDRQVERSWQEMEAAYWRKRGGD